MRMCKNSKETTMRMFSNFKLLHSHCMLLPFPSAHMSSCTPGNTRISGIEGCVPVHQDGWGVWDFILATGFYRSTSTSTDIFSVVSLTHKNTSVLHCAFHILRVHNEWQPAFSDREDPNCLSFSLYWAWKLPVFHSNPSRSNALNPQDSSFRNSRDTTVHKLAQLPQTAGKSVIPYPDICSHAAC